MKSSCPLKARVQTDLKTVQWLMTQNMTEQQPKSFLMQRNEMF